MAYYATQIQSFVGQLGSNRLSSLYVHKFKALSQQTPQAFIFHCTLP